MSRDSGTVAGRFVVLSLEDATVLSEDELERRERRLVEIEAELRDERLYANGKAWRAL